MTGLVKVTTRRPNPAPTGAIRRQRPPGGAVHRLHLASCRHAHGPLAITTTFNAWQFEVARFADEQNDYMLCKVCRPEEHES